MMKRPRSFISTLIVLLSLAFVPLGLTATTHDANAGGMPRVMDPRAGDPTEPSDGLTPDNPSITPDDGDPESIQQHPSRLSAQIWANPRHFRWVFTFLHLHTGGR